VSFYTPDICFSDALKYIPIITATRQLDPDPGLLVLNKLARLIEVVDQSLYEQHEAFAPERMLSRDVRDWPIVASSLLLDCPVWTEDQDFFGSGIATWTTNNVEHYLFQKIQQFGGISRQAGGVCAIEMALWDIAGKVYNCPVYQMLGWRDKVRIYADTTESEDPQEYGRRAKERKAMGITWMKMDLGINVIENTPGMVMQPAGQSKWELRDQPHPFMATEVTDKGIDRLCEYVAAVSPTPHFKRLRRAASSTCAIWISGMCATASNPLMSREP
jgi:hypothetical protein